MCGIFGVCNTGNAARVTAVALHQLQHRGQETFGLAVSDGKRIGLARKTGLVRTSIGENNFLDALPGSSAIGHVRYSTAGKKDGTETELMRSAHPIYMTTVLGEIAIVHNGTLTNATVLKEGLMSRGFTFQSDTDTEVALKFIITMSGRTLIDKIKNALPHLEGSFAFVILTPTQLIGIRDKWGIRPLVFGQRGHEYFFASETCAFKTVGASYIRDVDPGEIIVVDQECPSYYYYAEEVQPRPCIFELPYFSRPDSRTFGQSVFKVRNDLGIILAQESPVEADIVVPVPDSGVAAAQGYARGSGIPFETLGLIRHHNVGRTFIEPGNNNRVSKIDLKFTVNEQVVKGKRVVLVDDSLVRGNTTRLLVKRVREANAKEVHLRIAYPPWRYPCFWGIDTPTYEELLAHNCTTDDSVIKKACEETKADSIGFVSLEGLYEACGEGNSFCDACLTGNCPTT